MKILETRTHGYIDYLTGCLLLILPGVIGLDVNGREGYIPMITGILIIVYSLLTDYELGIAKILSMRTHLAIDFIGGALLAASPWLFQFADTIYVPHLAVGVFSIVVSLFTKTGIGGTIDSGTEI